MNQNIPITVAGAVRGYHAKPLARAHASRLTCSFNANEKAPLTPRILREQMPRSAWRQLTRSITFAQPAQYFCWWQRARYQMALDVVAAMIVRKLD